MSDQLTLDLREDVPIIRQFVELAAKEYARANPDAAVTGLQIFYAFQNGFIQFQLWTKHEYEPFCDNDYSYSQDLTLPHWRSHFERLLGEETTVVTAKGETIRTKPDPSRPDLAGGIGGKDAQIALGTMIVDILKSCRAEDVFDSMPRSDNWQMAVWDDEDWVAERIEDGGECSASAQAPPVVEDDAERVPCRQCGAMVLSATAAATGGICMRCKKKSEGSWRSLGK